jgi:hypothetical protein
MHRAPSARPRGFDSLPSLDPDRGRCPLSFSAGSSKIKIRTSSRHNVQSARALCASFLPVKFTVAVLFFGGVWHTLGNTLLTTVGTMLGPWLGQGAGWERAELRASLSEHLSQISKVYALSAPGTTTYKQCHTSSCTKFITKFSTTAVSYSSTRVPLRWYGRTGTIRI